MSETTSSKSSASTISSESSSVTLDENIVTLIKPNNLSILPPPPSPSLFLNPSVKTYKESSPDRLYQNEEEIRSPPKKRVSKTKVKDTQNYLNKMINLGIIAISFIFIIISYLYSYNLKYKRSDSLVLNIQSVLTGICIGLFLPFISFFLSSFFNIQTISYNNVCKFFIGCVFILAFGFILFYELDYEKNIPLFLVLISSLIGMVLSIVFIPKNKEFILSGILVFVSLVSVLISLYRYFEIPADHLESSLDWCIILVLLLIGTFLLSGILINSFYE